MISVLKSRTLSNSFKMAATSFKLNNGQQIPALGLGTSTTLPDITNDHITDYTLP